jgi:BirA family transcriptional regulator, biotin operon repressor / biotin---[acetyl-CoA-carboxylase] ligase
MAEQIIGTRIVHLGETASTNSHVTGILKENRPVEGTVFIADYQTRGRGMDSNSWESEKGKNLTFSILLYPTFLLVEHQFRLNQVLSLGISDFVGEKVKDGKVTIKWPNDIYINDKKVCGTLIQNSVLGYSFDYAVAGIGLNVNQEVFRSPAPNPISLRNVTSMEYDLEETLSALCSAIDKRYAQLISIDPAALTEEYLERLYRYNQWQRFLIKGSEEEARIAGISAFGQLLLVNAGGKEWTCDVKEVRYL